MFLPACFCFKYVNLEIQTHIFFHLPFSIKFRKLGFNGKIINLFVLNDNINDNNINNIDCSYYFP